MRRVLLILLYLFIKLPLPEQWVNFSPLSATRRQWMECGGLTPDGLCELVLNLSGLLLHNTIISSSVPDLSSYLLLVSSIFSQEASELSSLKPELEKLGVPLVAVVKEDIGTELQDFRPHFAGDIYIDEKVHYGPIPFLPLTPPPCFEGVRGGGKELGLRPNPISTPYPFPLPLQDKGEG